MLLYERSRSFSTSTYQRVPLNVKYFHIFDFKVRFNLSTTLAFTSSVSVVWKLILFSSNSICVGALMNSVPLSACKLAGFRSPNRSVNDVTTLLDDLFFNRIAHAYFGNTSIQVHRNLYPSLHFEIALISTESARHESSIPDVKMRLLRKCQRTGLCSVYTS